MRPISKVLAIAGVSAVAVASFASSAIAEPTKTPPDSTIVSAGSDTIQALSDQFQTDYKGGTAYASYDASGADLSVNITPKVGCTAIARPVGSSGGIAALGTNTRPKGNKTAYCIDLARSSRTPASTDPTNLAFVPIAGDAVTYSAEKTTNVPKNLTTADLTAIYSCSDASLGGSGTPVTENEIGGVGSDAVVPVLPQSTSGTRSFFLSEIGLGTGTAGPGGCVTTGNGGNLSSNTVEENEGTDPIFGTSSTYNIKDIVFPYSVAVDLSETIHGHGDSVNTPGPLVLHKVNNIVPTTGTGANTIINKNFPYQRQVFLVTRSLGAASSYIPKYLTGLLGDDNSKGYVCTAAGIADDKSYGFLPLYAKCGVITSSDLTPTS